ncbi:TIGR03767 family metallophosphoesterase [Nocardioides hankookensis]|uniref:TIGR03767 family metallophosphoesterase n=1 Tax=Nocardioides hankookensis TaxID=443157 RepID=A0ABW1LHS9_9ACTN
MQISRRDLIRTSAAAGAVIAAGGVGLADAAVAGTGPLARSTTRTTVLGKGPAGVGGFAPVVTQPGESYVVRGGLGAKARAGRAKRRGSLLAFAQISDVHIMDCQSPIRAEYGESFSSSAYRPQELLSAHVADAMVRQINAVRRGPVTGRKLAFTIQTGDNSDTGQYNELRWNIDVLDGGTLRVDSGDLTRYEGVMDQDPDFYDPEFWHPEGTPLGKADDAPRATYGFPVIPGLLDAARQPFDAVGLTMPWYAVMGNHDGLIQGNFPHSPAQNATAIGTSKKVKGGLNRTVTADPDRRILDKAAWVDEHFTTTGTPDGHGFTKENKAKKTAYYYFDQGPRGLVRSVVLDTVAPSGDQGALDNKQLSWLLRLLDRSKDKLVVLFSHHPLSSFTDENLSALITRELLARPQVVAWVNGHTHTNQIWAHPRKKKGKVVGGFWEINTASHIDWPQQARLLEIVNNRDGSLSIFATMLDHGGAVEPDLGSTDPVQLAGLSRLLAANDWQEHDENRRGARNARNVELLLPAPKFLRPKKKPKKK